MVCIQEDPRGGRSAAGCILLALGALVRAEGPATITCCCKATARLNTFASQQQARVQEGQQTAATSFPEQGLETCSFRVSARWLLTATRTRERDRLGNDNHCQVSLSSAIEVAPACRSICVSRSLAIRAVVSPAPCRHAFPVVAVNTPSPSAHMDAHSAIALGVWSRSFVHQSRDKVNQSRRRNGPGIIAGALETRGSQCLCQMASTQ